MDSQPIPPPYLAGAISLAPFRATMLRPNQIGDPSSHRLVARPWKAVPGRLASWQRRGRLIRDLDEALYVHEYAAHGVVIRGVVGLLPLDARTVEPTHASVVPHELVQPRQSDELADRVAQMQLLPAPIMIAVTATALGQELARVGQTAPLRQYADFAGQHHKLWSLRDPDTQRAIDAHLAQTTGMIVDGHHRYAAAHRLYLRTPTPAYRHTLAMIIDQETTPFEVRAIHRVFARLALEDLQTAARAVGLPFEFRPAESTPAADGAVLTDGKRWAAVGLTEPGGVTAVEALHRRLLPALPRGPWEMSFHHSRAEALSVRRSRGGIAVLLPPPEFDSIRNSAIVGRVMPEKATSFQPKPSLGSMMHELRP